MDINQPHRRYNALTGDWILVSPQRTQRPWQGKVESAAQPSRPQHDPTCYLCPGNPRAGNAVNPQYASTYVFTNDFAALTDTGSPSTCHSEPTGLDALYRAEQTRGTCRVICFSPRHDLTLPEMPLEAIENVIAVWKEQILDLGEHYLWVQVFENKGEIMGCSNPHPHGQVWAGNFLPNEVAKEHASQKRYAVRYNSPLLVDYLKSELERGERIVSENASWVATVPFWALWPYETILLPRRHVSRLTDLTPDESSDLARILKSFLSKYDNLFETSFPYSMGWHGAPHDDKDNSHWQLHAHFYPPLLRSATVKKFMVGYEMLSEPQRDITPETAASQLRSLSDEHYRLRG